MRVRVLPGVPMNEPELKRKYKDDGISFRLAKEASGRWEVVEKGPCYFDLFDEEGCWVMTDVDEDGKQAKLIAEAVNKFLNL